MLTRYAIYALAATIVIPCSIGVVKYKKLPKPVLFITWWLIIGLLCESIMIWFSTMHINNLFAMHVFTVVEIILISLYFLHVIKNETIRKVILVSGSVSTVFAVGYAINGNNLLEFNSLPQAIECAYFTFLSCWFFHEMSNNLDSGDDCHYFINGSILFYFSSSFLVFGFSRYVSPNNEALMVMYSLHSIINALCNLTYAFGIWTASKRYYTPV
jgi:hypothetical protein